jgi:hypothetical protein
MQDSGIGQLPYFPSGDFPILNKEERICLAGEHWVCDDTTDDEL